MTILGAWSKAISSSGIWDRRRFRRISDPVNVFAVVSSGSFRGHFDLATRRGLTQFVGRENELRQMDQALQTVLHGRGQLMCIVADAGTGKSRLFHEFEANLPNQCKLFEARSASHGKRATRLPVLELLRGYFTIDLIDTSAHLLFRSGRAEQAHTILSPIYNWFSEGFDYEDFLEARCTLDESTASVLEPVHE